MNATSGSSAISKLMDVQQVCNEWAGDEEYVLEGSAAFLATIILGIIKEKR